MDQFLQSCDSAWVKIAWFSMFDQILSNVHKFSWTRGKGADNRVDNIDNGWQVDKAWTRLDKYSTCMKALSASSTCESDDFFSWVAIVLQLKLLNHNGWWPEQGNLHETTISWTWNRQRLRSLQGPILLVGSFWIICPSVPVFVSKLWSWSDSCESEVNKKQGDGKNIKKKHNSVLYRIRYRLRLANLLPLPVDTPFVLKISAVDCPLISEWFLTELPMLFWSPIRTNLGFA